MDHQDGVPQDYYTSPQQGPGATGPNRQRTAVFLLLAAAIAIGVVLYSTANDGGGEEAGEIEPVPDTTPDGVETLEITPAAPWDGKASKFHPVVVSPATGLADGSVVTVEGWEFPPNRELGIVQCTNVAVVEGSGGCNIGRFEPLTTNADGYFIGQFTVERYLVVNGAQWDCLQGNVDPDEIEQRRTDGFTLPGLTDIYFTCVVAAGAIDDYDESGGFPISFEGHAPFVPLPDPDPDGTTTTGPPTPPDPDGSGSGNGPATTVTIDPYEPYPPGPYPPGIDPWVPYPGDPNQPYPGDPNQPYPDDPNQPPPTLSPDVPAAAAPYPDPPSVTTLPTD